MFIHKDLDHPNVIKLKYYFLSSGPTVLQNIKRNFFKINLIKEKESFLNLIMEYMPSTLH